eukprot:TRINITY_DN16398_c0_g1_i1.p1 TRINITY_DN16398_c0_g1~~TRINITY_DN16398_c0_g1_i1.p1  ORF type:complete len:187 (+),score=39.49 TRINITY_DN16398_c0_g1_i1:18-578(+)
MEDTLQNLEDDESSVVTNSVVDNLDLDFSYYGLKITGLLDTCYRISDNKTGKDILKFEKSSGFSNKIVENSKSITIKVKTKLSKAIGLIQFGPERIAILDVHNQLSGTLVLKVQNIKYGQDLKIKFGWSGSKMVISRFENTVCTVKCKSALNSSKRTIEMSPGEDITFLGSVIITAILVAEANLIA